MYPFLNSDDFPMFDFLYSASLRLFSFSPSLLTLFSDWQNLINLPLVSSLNTFPNMYPTIVFNAMQWDEAYRIISSVTSRVEMCIYVTGNISQNGLLSRERIKKKFVLYQPP